MRKRDAAYKKAKRTGNPVDWRKAVFLRNRVEMAIKNYKRNKITENLDRHRHNPTKFWKEIGTVMPKSSVAEVSVLKDEETGRDFSSKDLSDHINSYFANIGGKLADAIVSNSAQSDITCEYNYPMGILDDGVSGEDFSVNEFEKTLKLINHKKSSAITNIRSHVILDQRCHSRVIQNPEK